MLIKESCAVAFVRHNETSDFNDVPAEMPANYDELQKLAKFESNNAKFQSITYSVKQIQPTPLAYSTTTMVIV